MTVTDPFSKPVRLANGAWAAALADKPERAMTYVKRISDECGGDGIHLALKAWIDTYAEHATGGRPGTPAPEMAFIEEATGKLDRPGSPRLPAPVEWAGKLVHARCAMDFEKFMALMDDIPSDPPTSSGLYVMTVLITCARSVNGMPRGFANVRFPTGGG